VISTVVPEPGLLLIVSLQPAQFGPFPHARQAMTSGTDAFLENLGVENLGVDALSIFANP